MAIEAKGMRNPNSWSELPLDLSISFFKRLGFADFQRAKSVCSSWHSASKQSVPKKNQIHWLILFPKDNNSCAFLFNPEEKDKKLYKSRDLGFEESSVCLATYGSWLLMEYQYPPGNNNLYIVNLFTREMINLPPVEESYKDSHVFWIDDKTKDYVVLFGSFGDEKSHVVYCYKKGDDDKDLMWKQIPETPDCFHLVYKDHKLYFLSMYRVFKIFDFRENIPRETFECGVYLERLRYGVPRPTQLVVSVTKGREVVFKVEKFSRPTSFRVSMIYSGCSKETEEVVDLGDEAILLDQGITVLANEGGGFVRNSIYYSSERNHKILRFDLKTRRTKPLHELESSSVQFSSARWFLPSFTNT